MAVLATMVVAGLMSPLPGPAAVATTEAPGTWSNTGFLQHPRVDHAQVLLPSGEVLVVGGDKAGTAEIYHPPTRSWSHAPAVGFAATHAVVLAPPGCPATPPGPGYPCGRVLVTGAGREARLFDPVATSWSDTGVMADRQSGYTLTLLGGEPCRRSVPAENCGKVLAVGAPSEPELYDPVAGTWTRLPILLPPHPTVGDQEQTEDFTTRNNHTATLLDGPECSGPAPPVYCGEVLLAGGTGSTVVEHSSPPTTWPTTTTSSLPRTVSPSTTPPTPTTPPTTTPPTTTSSITQRQRTLLPGPPAVIFDPDGGSFLPTAPMLGVHSGHSSALLRDGTVLVAGGGACSSGLSEDDPCSVIAAPERYEPATKTWRRAAPLQTPRVGLTITLVYGPECDVADSRPAHCGSVVAAGGWTRSTIKPENLSAPLVPSGETEIYDPKFDTWRRSAPLLSPRFGHRATLLGGGKVLATAGSPSTTLADVERLDASELFDPSSAPAFPSVTAVEPRIGSRLGGTRVVLTGAGFTGATSVRFGDAEAPFVVEAPDRITATSPPHVVEAVHVTVTTAAGASTRTRLDRFSYVEGHWRATGSMGVARAGHTATATQKGDRVLVTLGTSAEIFDVSGTDADTGRTGTWRSAARLPSDHRRASATLLVSGEVLVVGGFDRADIQTGSSVDKAVLYDFEKDKWRPAAEMGATRFDHTATRLRDGSVLVVGGRRCAGGSCQLLDSAAVYTPDSDTWSDVGVLASARYGHTATLLPSGGVLVAGGVDASGAPVARAEIFSPADRQWSTAGEVVVPRRAHTATLLGDGRVLLSGGTDAAGTPTAATELFDPASGRWARVAPARAARSGHTAVLMDAGPCGDNCGKVLVAGGWGADGEALRTSEVYDPITHSWRPNYDMVSARSEHTATLLGDGQVVVAGGRVLVADGCCGKKKEAIGDAELFRPSPPMSEPVVTRLDPPVGRPNRSTEVSLRGAGLSRVQTVHFGDIATQPTFVSDTEVRAVAPAQLRGTVPVTVTTSSGAVSLPSFDARFTYSSGHWLGVAALAEGLPDCTRTEEARQQAHSTRQRKLGPVVEWAFGALFGSFEPHPGKCQARYQHTATLLESGEVLVAGGGFAERDQPIENNFQPPYARATAELYNPASATWRQTAPLLGGRRGHTATLLWGPACSSPGVVRPPHCGRVLVVGGGDVNSLATASTELYDPRTGTWAPAAPLSDRRVGHSATLLGDGRVLVMGGTQYYDFRPPLASAEVYDPVLNAWSPTGALDSCAPAPSCTARTDHAATVLASGDVLVAGGLGMSKIETLGGATANVVVDAIDPSLRGDERVISVCRRLPSCAPPLRVLASAQIYNVATGRWAPADDMGVERYGHTATLLDKQPCGQRCGGVLVVGGLDGSSRHVKAAEVFDFTTTKDSAGKAATGSWAPTPPPNFARGAHSASVLANGTVLAVGGGQPIRIGTAVSVASAELYDPVAGTWTPSHPMSERRGGHTATVLSGPLCHQSPPPAWCGSALVVAGDASTTFERRLPVASTEVYVPDPDVVGLDPALGPSSGGTPVVISGSGFSDKSVVAFDGVRSPSWRADSSTRITALSPAHQKGVATVTVTNPDGSSATIEPNPAHRFLYVVSQPPGRVEDLAARVISESEIELSFSAPPSDGAFPPPAGEFLIKESGSPMTNAASFDAASPICDPRCRFTPSKVGQKLTLRVDNLAPGTTYHYALRAVNEVGTAGPLSNTASVTTAGTPATVARTSGTSDMVSAPPCPPLPTAAGPNQILYPPGYSIVGLPAGTLVPTRSSLYTWFDQGAGGSYKTHLHTEAVEAGRGYWAWLRCGAVVDIGGSPATAPAQAVPLGAYHASMVGNPSGAATAKVSGHDFAATWEPGLNGGAGGYRLSGYRETFSLNRGQGAWVFSYDNTNIKLGP